MKCRRLPPGVCAGPPDHARNHEAADDYWLAKANATMLPDEDERSEALGEAREAYREAIGEAREKYEARLDLSETLHEWR